MWILIRKFEPSEKTKKELNFYEKYDVWWNTKTNKIICDCPGFYFNGRCKHIKEFKEKLEKVLIKLRNQENEKN